MSNSLITKRDVAAMLNISQQTVARVCKDDASFPQPIRLGTALRWQFSEIQEWIEAQSKSARRSAEIAVDRAKMEAEKAAALAEEAVFRAMIDKGNLTPNDARKALSLNLTLPEITSNDPETIRATAKQHVKKAISDIREADDHANDPETGGAQ